MSDSVKKVLQCSSKAADAPEMESNVYWSTAFAKPPVKASLSIHFSRTSQPPRFTPRRNGIVVAVNEEEVEVELVFEVGIDTDVEEVSGTMLENVVGACMVWTFDFEDDADVGTGIEEVS
jgi:hypothetical protein